MELGKKIRQLRYKANLTQEQLAEQLGIGAQSVSKWENSVAMPDISALPLIAEIFGVSIDDLFDLTTEQRLNRMENRMDAEDDLPPDVFLEYEEFLKSQLGDETYKKRATELIAYLYYHRMETYGRKARRFARDAVRSSPDEKGCQWILSKAEGHAVWDWNMANHTQAIDFYRGIVEENPGAALPYMYLIDNLLADRRADEAEKYLERLASIKGDDHVMIAVYKAHVALARFDKPAADRVIEELIRSRPDDAACCFEAAQYYAGTCRYDKALEYYELSFANTKRYPRFQDELLGIADIYKIKGEYRKAAETYDRIIDLLRTEWGLTDESDIQHAERKKAEMLAKAK